MNSPAAGQGGPGHRRARSTATLKSILTPQHPGISSRTPSKGLPQRNSRSTHAPLGEIENNAVSLAQLASPPATHLDLGSSKMGIRKERAGQKGPFGATRSTPLGNTQNPNNTEQSAAITSPARTISPSKFSFAHRRAQSAVVMGLKKEISTPSKQEAGMKSTLRTPIWAEFATQADDRFANEERGRRPAADSQRYPKQDNQKTRTEDEGKGGSTAPAVKKSSKVMAAVAIFGGIARDTNANTGDTSVPDKDLDAAFEAVLVSRNIPEKQRQSMRSLDARIKEEFIKNNSSSDPESPTKTSTSCKRSFSRGRSKSKTRGTDDAHHTEQASPSKRSRSRGRVFTFSKKEDSPSKRPRSISRPRSFMLHRNSSSTSIKSLGKDATNDLKETTSTLTNPSDYVIYLKKTPQLQDIEIGRMHKLRLLLRNETVQWVDCFIADGGLSELLDLLNRIMSVEWREEHEDLLLHEVLLCLKGLCTTELALQHLAEVAPVLFPRLLKMLFDDERRGPSEFSTRGIIVTLLFNHLGAAKGTSRQANRARELLGFLSDPKTSQETQLQFIQQMHKARPYQLWRRELTNVTKEVFWIFLHHLNVVSTGEAKDFHSTGDYTSRHFPCERPPVPAAPYVGGVEWDATNYIAAHLDLLNGLIASLPTRDERNQLRAHLQSSGIENCMGVSLRTCKEKFYGCVHDGLRTWIFAAAEDGWIIETVRSGPPQNNELNDSPTKSPRKGGKSAKDEPPRLELPRLELPQIDAHEQRGGGEDWL